MTHATRTVTPLPFVFSTTRVQAEIDAMEAHINGEKEEQGR